MPEPGELSSDDASNCVRATCRCAGIRRRATAGANSPDDLDTDRHSLPDTSPRLYVRRTSLPDVPPRGLHVLRLPADAAVRMHVRLHAWRTRLPAPEYRGHGLHASGRPLPAD